MDCLLYTIKIQTDSLVAAAEYLRRAESAKEQAFATYDKAKQDFASAMDRYDKAVNKALEIYLEEDM